MARQHPGDHLTARRRPTRAAVLRISVCAVLLVGALAVGLLAVVRSGALSPRASSSVPPPSQPSSSRASSSSSPSSSSPASPLRVVALGDSVTAGTRCGCVPFPQLYAAALEQRSRVPVRITNDGVAGATSADILAGLAAQRAVVGAANLVVVTVGANDFTPLSGAVLSGTCGRERDLGCAQGTLATLQRNLTATVSRIRELHSSGPVTVLLTGYWNVYEDGNVADDDYSNAGQAASIALTQAVNQRVQAVALATHAIYVNLFTPFKGDDGNRDATPLLADDGDHPSAAGHRVIARALLSRTDLSALAAGGRPGPPSGWGTAPTRCRATAP